MKQNMKRLLLVFCTIACLFVLSGCAKTEDSGSAELTDDIKETLVDGAAQYLTAFAGYSDEDLEEQIKKAEKTENTVISTALTSWKSVKDDLGELQLDETGAPLILTDEESGGKALTVAATGEDTYEVSMTVAYEQRDLDFVMTAESQEDQYGSTVLTVTEMTFTPFYTIGEKLEKAFLNMVMGMGTVFIVLIFISLIISCLKIVNGWEKKKKDAEKTEAKAEVKAAPKTAANIPTAAPAPAKTPVPAKAPAVPAVTETAEKAEESQKNLADDLELVAVITAAISAAQNVPAEGLVVRSIRRKSGSHWKRS